MRLFYFQLKLVRYSVYCDVKAMKKTLFLIVLAVLLVLTIAANVVLYLISDDVNDMIQTFEQQWQEQADIVLQEARLLDDLEHQLSQAKAIHQVRDYHHPEPDAEPSADEYMVHLYRTLGQLSELDLQAGEIEALAVVTHYAGLYQKQLTEADSAGIQNQATAALSEQLKNQHQHLDEALRTLRQGLETRFSRTREAHQLTLQDIIYRDSLEGLLLLILIVMMLLVSFMMLRAQIRAAKERDCLFDAIPDALLYCDSEGRITQVNHSCSELFGYSAKELVNMQLEALMPERFRELHAKHRASFYGRAKMRRKGENGLNIIGLHKLGQEIPLDIAIARTTFGQETYYVAVIRDLRPELQLQQRAELDFLTQAFNRGQIERVLGDELTRAVRYSRALSVMMVDLDHFKTLNDTMGHQVGDAALTELSAFLKRSIRPSDCLGRWGGDEFVIVCPEIASDEALLMAQRLVSQYQQMNQYDLEMSIGVTSRANLSSGVECAQLIGEADDALYQAKAAGRGRAVLFSNQ
ncbi:hypothetical protein C3B51_16860 [Pseudoalteromonas rubra]|uniref:Diguanylate cyclase n=2 Tax=Pseudoalteromonas rubra TaxID=43658 RepID=A0A4Q7E5D3_9GAMM|nr:hypothetical protein C3B51_16860 [Pseudoalteromonas rubra]